ncbi:MAG: B12-binding domain-containing radical SAM protein, partial [Deltaproteobacteria bacterium]|nr:B12-binding domain-containing radical SAM protein [Deltaproteobacteria bacterium]
MYICSSLRQNGYVPAILNLDLERLSFQETIDRIKAINPRYIGFSGIVSTSYGIIKRLSRDLRNILPDRKQILGGGLSAAWEPVLENTAIDVIVRGEGDETIIELLQHLDEAKNISGIKGIAFRDGQGAVYTGRRRLFIPLDRLPYPDFDAVDFDRYLVDGLEFIHRFTKNNLDQGIYDSKRRNKRMITIPVSRGCFGKCTFCYRAYPGLRTHSFKYIFDFVEYCIDRFDVGFFTFGDECFAPNKKWNWGFLKELEKRKLDIVFRILGMRVDTVDQEILRAYKEAGCWMIEYGFESGSQKMLNIIDKRVSVEENRQVALWTNEVGIYTSPALVLGMPGETSYTIGESIRFLDSLDLGFRKYQMAYAMPIPGAPLYEYAKLSGIISDEDEYLEMISGKATDQP